MLLPLDDHARRNLRALAASLCLSSLLLTPIAGRSSLELTQERTAIDERFMVSSLPAPSGVRALSISRDPFVSQEPGAALAGSLLNPAVTTADDSLVGTRVIQGESTGIPLPGGHGQANVHAIVTGGDAPRALVEENGQSRVVAVGDALDGSRIAAIDSSGIRLANGDRLNLAREHP